VPLVGERGPQRRRQRVADTGAAGDAVPLIGLVEIPQLVRPGELDRSADQRPVLILDLVVDLGA